MSNIIQELEKEQLRTDLPVLEVGDTVRVFVKVIEGNRERLQNFEGIVSCFLAIFMITNETPAKVGRENFRAFEMLLCKGGLPGSRCAHQNDEG